MKYCLICTAGLQIQRSGGIDPYTGSKVSILTVMSAKYMIATFTATEQIKSKMKSDGEKMAKGARKLLGIPY